MLSTEVTDPSEAGIFFRDSLVFQELKPDFVIDVKIYCIVTTERKKEKSIFHKFMVR